MIVLNDVSDPAIGFESGDNAVTLIDAEGEGEVPRWPARRRSPRRSWTAPGRCAKRPQAKAGGRAAAAGHVGGPGRG